MDGWGYSANQVGNAIAQAKTPTIDFINQNYPAVLLQASGPAVGLPWGEIGNSEVGHLTIGAGRIILQYLTRINQAIDDDTFFTNESLLKAAKQVKNKNSALHIMGLITSGTVHSSLKHLYALLDFAKQQGLEKVYVHLFTDGKDSKPKESALLLKQALDYTLADKIGQIITVVGRGFSMDRDENWDRTQKAYDLLTAGQGNKTTDLLKSIEEYHSQGINDEAVPPTILEGSEDKLIKDNDAVIFFNFREDSVRQLTRAFVDKEFSFFALKPMPNLLFVTMTDYSSRFNILPVFKQPEIKNQLAEVLELNGKKQLHIAETEKYAHATYFFNGLREEPFEHETDVFIQSHKNLLENPGMKALEIGERIEAEIKNGNFDFIVANFANPDILAHSGDYNAAVQGISIMDQALKKIYDAAKEKNAILLITSDHGNAESLSYAGTGEKETRHNLNPVPFYLIADSYEKQKTEKELKQELSETKGILADIAPTILQLIDIPIPQEMTGNSLAPYLIKSR